MSRELLTKTTLLLLLIASGTALAQSAGDRPAFCPVQLDIPERPVVEEGLQPGAMAVSADTSETIEGGITHLQGNVEVTRGAQQLRADNVDIDQARETADVSGNVNYWDDEIYLHGQSAHLDLAAESASIGGAEFRIFSNHGRGSADELHVIANKASSGRGIDYTTCDPDDNAWKLSAGDITLNHEAGWGTGKNVVLKVMDIPVLYTPYLTFPLNNERKTGFLTPEFGNTRRNGFEVQTPFYWNIAPAADATLTPRLLSDSGVMLMGEFRYLLENGGGYFNAEYLPSDSNFNDDDRSYISLEHEQSLPYNGRLHVVFNNLSDQHYLEDFGQTLELTSLSAVDRVAELSFTGDNWQAFARVQDFQTINRTPPLTDTRIGLINILNINLANPTLLDPYKRLPQIGFNYNSPRTNRAFNFNLDSEFVYFERNERGPLWGPLALGTPVFIPGILPFTPAGTSYGIFGINLVPRFPLPPTIINPGVPPFTTTGTFFVTAGNPFVPFPAVLASNPFNFAPNNYLPDIDGMRFNINPSVSYPVRTSSSFIEPKVGIRYTAYSLDDAGPFDDSPDRLLPYASLDGGLFLEREVSLFDEQHIQTLEPRFYYLYIPREGQNDIPVFDTGLYDDSFDSLFYENRYTGIDRINDANRVTLSLTSRLINNDGRELGHLSVGQIIYFDEQDVRLPGQRFSDDDLSPLVFELGTRLNDDLTFLAGWQWEPNENRMQKVNLQARYHPESGKVLNFAYRVRDAYAGAIRTDAIDIEQTDVSMRWPLSSEWSVVGRWIYALEESKSLDIFGGIEYDSCCWGVRVVGRRFVSNVEGDVQTGIFLQFQLKGLAGIGQKTVDFLNQNIPGY